MNYIKAIDYSKKMNVWIAFFISLAMILGILGIVFVVVILDIFGCCKEDKGTLTEV